MSHRESDPFERWLRGWRAVCALGVFWTFVGVMGFLYQYLDIFVRGGSEPFQEKLIEEMTGAYGGAVGFVGLVWIIRRMVRAERSGWPMLGAHLLLMPLYSVFHTTWNWGTRVGSFALFGLGTYDYGIMWLRFLMEFPRDLLDYTMMALLVHLVIAYRASRDRELQVEQLRSELTTAQLESLAAQLRPHFLFNALNTISSIMYRSVDEADRMIRRLGDLLRRSLRKDSDQLVPLADELETLELYLDVMRSRFEDRVVIDVVVPPDVERARVPPLVLQPLVENAFEHGDPGAGETARVGIGARIEHGKLVLHVEDNGPGPDRGAPRTEGVGLHNTRARLHRLFGEDHTLTMEPGPNGGCLVTLSIPQADGGPP